ncbi:unnamed protein product [Choristocarpus tenellus]
MALPHLSLIACVVLLQVLMVYSFVPHHRFTPSTMGTQGQSTCRGIIREIHNCPSRLQRTMRMDAVREVTAEELEKEFAEWSTPLILDVHAIWCGPCLMLKPELEEAAKKLEGKVRVVKMDSDEYPDIASALRVYGLPTLMYMKDGEIKFKSEGAVPAADILRTAEQYLLGGEPPADPAAELFIETD